MQVLAARAGLPVAAVPQAARAVAAATAGAAALQLVSYAMGREIGWDGFAQLLHAGQVQLCCALPWDAPYSSRTRDSLFV